MICSRPPVERSHQRRWPTDRIRPGNRRSSKTRHFGPSTRARPVARGNARRRVRPGTGYILRAGGRAVLSAPMPLSPRETCNACPSQWRGSIPLATTPRADWRLPGKCGRPKDFSAERPSTALCHITLCDMHDSSAQPLCFRASRWSQNLRGYRFGSFRRAGLDIG